MQAAVYQGPSKAWPEHPIALEEIDMPHVGPDDVLIKVAACGLCHTDLTYLHGNPTPKKPPIILGHEPSGIIVQTGSNVQNVKCGDNVIVSSLIPCLTCEQCRSGHENLCTHAILPGATKDGAFAEYVAVPASGVYSLPGSLPLEESCIISDAVCTAYHAIYQVANVRPGDTIAVYGATGGVGLLCVQFASLIGANVIGIGRKKIQIGNSQGIRSI